MCSRVWWMVGRWCSPHWIGWNLTLLDCVSVMDRLMKIARRVAGWQYELVNQLAERAVAADDFLGARILSQFGG